MKSNEAFDLAFKYADMSAKILQIFLFASVAIGGWFMASTDLRATAPASFPRIAFGVLYASVGTMTWVYQSTLMRRANACLRIADLRADADLKDCSDFQMIVAGLPRFGTDFGIPVVVVIVDIFMLLFSGK